MVYSAVEPKQDLLISSEDLKFPHQVVNPENWSGITTSSSSYSQIIGILQISSHLEKLAQGMPVVLDVPTFDL